MDDVFSKVLRFLDAVSRGKSLEEVVEEIGPLTIGECEILEEVYGRPVEVMYPEALSPMVQRLIREGYIEVRKVLVLTEREPMQVKYRIVVTEKGRRALETICKKLKEKYGR